MKRVGGRKIKCAHSQEDKRSNKAVLKKKHLSNFSPDQPSNNKGTLVLRTMTLLTPQNKLPEVNCYKASP